MEILPTILAILSVVFAGTTLIQLFTIKAQKDKAKISVKVEQAKADEMNLANLKQALIVKGETMLMVEKANQALIKESYERDRIQRETSYKLGELERKVSGMERIITEEIARRSFAENNICLNKNCELRIPKIGEFNTKNKEQNNE